MQFTDEIIKVKETETFRLVATTAHGLEDVLVEELKTIGAIDIEKQTRAVTFTADKALMYKANLTLRTAIRILKPFTSFRAGNEDIYYKKLQETDWSELMGVHDTLAVNTVVHSSIFTHSKFMALKAKDAIVDQFRLKFGKRPNVKIDEPTLRIHILINQDLCEVFLDSSGESLHKRGYRFEYFKAPISEVLAAGMVLISGWKGDTVFMDPMCGSGTILAEAAMIAANIAPQKHREYFGFKNWTDYDEALWTAIRQEAIANEVQPKHDILGFDIAFQAIRIAQRNLERAGVLDFVKIKRKDFERHNPPTVETGTVIMNPPYGERIEAEDYETNAFYAMMGDHLKAEYTNYDVWMISSNMEALKCVGLRASNKHTLFNGALECKFQCYQMYKGSKKTKNQETGEDE